MSLLVYDKKLNNMTEYYTNESVKLEHIYQEMVKQKSGSKRTRTNKILTVRSIDANQKITT